MHESICSHAILNSFYNYSLSIVNFGREIVEIFTCKSDFLNSYFLQRAALSEYLQP